MRADVVVVGAGPVGLLVAAELAGYGVRTVVFEAEPAVSERPKATTVHARAVQCLARRGRLTGLVPPLSDPSKPQPQPQPQPSRPEWDRTVTRPFRYAGLAGLTISSPGSEPEPLLKCPQADLERAFEAQARAGGARVLRGRRVYGLDIGTDGVRVSARACDGRGPEVVCAASYVVGADGARGVVRELAGIGSETWPATVSSMMAQVALPDPSRLAPGWHSTPRGWIVATPVAGGRVSLRTLNPSPDPDPKSADPGRSAADGRYGAPTAGELSREVARILGAEVALGDPRWLSRFNDFSRLAHAYRRGRVLLVGDAAHIHFPIGGQGLSTGVLDALDLSWKLALTIHGTAAADLLDSYAADRRPAARRVIEDTRTQLLLMRPDPALDPLRARLVEQLADGPANARLAAALSAQDTVVSTRTERPSAGEGRFLTNRLLATRNGPAELITLLRPGRPLLLLSGPRAEAYRRRAAPWAAILRIVEVASSPGAPELPGEALLVRPDGYIGWASGSSGLAEALTAYFGPPADAVASSKTLAARSGDSSREASTEETATLGST